MDRLKRKELQQLKLQKELKLLQHRTTLKSIIKGQQTLQIALKYAKEYLLGHQIDTLSEYSPVQISRLVFDKQLKQIESFFSKLPDNEAYISQFIIIMLKVLKFPFEKNPLFMVGLKDMFYQIAQQGQKAISYHQVFKYILGELVTMKEEQQNTEFQVRLIQKKKQDYLLHDNGIKKVYYSKDLKMIFSLDQRSKTVKMYDQEMKNICKFAPKKEKHQNKFPIILDFDYSEITERLAVILSDQTLSIVNLAHLLQKTETEFDANPMNEVVITLPEKMRRIFFVQMMNKWLTCTEQGNKLYLYDMDKYRTQPEKVESKLKINLNDQTFSEILEVVQLSCICVVAGNQVSFYNENFTEVKFKKFSHCEEIKHFKYSDEKNQFYLCGLQKNLTIFSINRSGVPSKIWTFPTNKLIASFQVFPYFDTIVIADQSNDLKLMHETTRVVYQQLSYSHIVKAKDKSLNIAKISKNEFSVYQTYMIVMNQQKIAIQKDIEYSFLPYHYYDQEKQQLYLSVNNQIISFSLFSGEIRKNYSMQSSNIQKHHCIFMGHKCPLFILDHQFNIYEVYQNDEVFDGQNKNYRKKINIQEVINCFYDSQLNTFMAINKDSINQIRNDHNNNFNTINFITFEGFHKIISSCFCQKTKTITLLTSDQLVYQIKNYQVQINACFKFIFPKDATDHEEKLIRSIHYDYLYDIFVLFSNKNQIYFVERITHRQIYFNLSENMPPKLKHLQFITCKYQLVTQKKGHVHPYILIHDQTGFLVQFALHSIFEEYKFNSKAEEVSIRPTLKDGHTIVNQGIKQTNILLNQNNRLKKTYEEIGLLKAHQKQIALALKVKVQTLVTITISIDGYIRLWNDKYSLLFSLKIPSLLKISWNMKEIQAIKTKKSIEELLVIFKENYAEILQQHSTPAQICSKSKRIKFKQEPPKINLKDPIKIEMDKDLQQIVMQKEEYKTTYSKGKYQTQSFFHTTSKIYPHPWRRKKQFVQLYDKASPTHKYKLKIPDNLLEMRNSLDMKEKIKKALDYKQAERILPQLAIYEAQKFISQRKQQDKTIENEEEAENFQSCLYVKSQKRKKKINQFDEIDKEFKKKEMMLTARKWVPKKRKERATSVAEMKSEILGYNNEGKIDPIKAIQNIFEEHNRECLEQKKGRLIRIPKISLSRDIY